MFIINKTVLQARRVKMVSASSRQPRALSCPVLTSQPASDSTVNIHFVNPELAKKFTFRCCAVLMQMSSDRHCR